MARKRDRAIEAYSYAQERWATVTGDLARIAAAALKQPDIGRAINIGAAQRLAGEVELLDLIVEDCDKPGGA